VKPDAGTLWDVAGPGEPRGTTFHRAKIGNGATYDQAVEARGAHAVLLNLSADIVEFAPGGSVSGHLRPAGGADMPLPSEKFCARSGGCFCPDGSKVDLPMIQHGDALLGYAGGLGAGGADGTVLVTGESVDKFCTKAPRGLEVRGGPGGNTVLATFLSGTCSVSSNGFHATAKAGAWSIDVKIADFKGYSHHYTLRYGGDPSFVIDGPGGPYSNQYSPPRPPSSGGAILFYPGGKIMSLGFIDAFTRDLGNGVLPVGAMACKKPKR
jgi:hypothetical protein